MTDVDRKILLRALRALRTAGGNSFNGSASAASAATSAAAAAVAAAAAGRSSTPGHDAADGSPSPGAAASAAVANWLLNGSGSAAFNSSQNLSGPSGDANQLMENRYWVLIMFLVPLFTIFGNILVVLAVYRERGLQSVTNYFIVSLAFADILVAAIVMPVSVYVEVRNGHWDFSDTLCDLWIMCDALFSTASILNLVAISIDRFIAVTQPIKYAKHKNSKRTHVTIAGSWLLSIAIALPIGCGLQNLQGVRYQEKFRNVCTFFNGDFLIYSSLGSFYIPCIVMLVLYYRIFTVIRARAQKAAANRRGKVYENAAAAAATSVVPAEQLSNVDAEGDRPRQRMFQLKLKKKKSKKKRSDRSAARREKKATKTLAIVLGVFLLCWLPFFITNLMWAACLKNMNGETALGPICGYDRRINVFIVWLGYVNSFMNPLIYTIFNTEFRKAFKKILHID